MKKRSYDIEDTEEENEASKNEEDELFFGEEKQESDEKTAENEKQDKNPYEKENFSDLEAKSDVKKSRVLYYVLSVVIAVCSFLGGVLAVELSIDPEMRSLMRVKDAIDNLYYKDVDDSQFYGVLFDAINEDLLDDYSRYMTADEYTDVNKDATGSRSGVGLVFLTQNEASEAQMLITRVCGNSPAEAAGLTAGMYVVGFGNSETEIKSSVVFDEFSAFLNEYDAGEKFFVKTRQGGEERIVELYKEDYVENYVFYRSATTAYRFIGEKATELTAGGEPLQSLPTDAAYIRLTQFNGSAAEEFDKAMKLFREERKKHLVLDLRGNGGGYLDVMQRISAYFCKTSTKKKPVVAVADYGEYKESFAASGNYYYEYFTDESRICVLADNETASASECLIGCMIDYEAVRFENVCLAERAGTAKTFGKGIMQTTYPLLFGGDAIKLTTAQILWPVSGHCIHGRGILPDDGALTVKENAVDEKEIENAIEILFS